MADVIGRWALLIAILVGCQSAPPATLGPAGSAVSAAPGPSRLLLEGDDATRLLDPDTGTVVGTLPGGVLSPTKDLLVRITAAGSETLVDAVDLTGLARPALRLSGEHKMPSAYGAAPSGFAPNGNWLVLYRRDAKDSRFTVIDVARWTVAKTVTLGTRFTFDAIHNDGGAMYLIEHPTPGSTAYNVRLYDLRGDRLLPEIIFDKAAIAQFDPTVGLMDGTFHVSVAPKHGLWNYGLYMRPNGAPFVHALNVPGRYAQCIVDLAGKWTATSTFSMVTSDDARRLFVVDTGGGSLSVIDGDTQRVLKRSTFAGRPANAPVRTSSAVLAPSAATLYATAARGIAAIDAQSGSLKTWLAPGLAASSLAISPDGARLYALAEGKVRVIHTASGSVSDAALADGAGARALHVIPAR